MTIKQRIEQIQKMVDQLQWDINSLDEGMKYYNIIIYDFSENPMTIFVLAKDPSMENAMVASQKVDFLDLFYPSKFISELENEFERLKKINAPQKQFDELKKIREIFGV